MSLFIIASCDKSNFWEISSLPVVYNTKEAAFKAAKAAAEHHAKDDKAFIILQIVGETEVETTAKVLEYV